jgi:hypothetical protein
MSRGGGNIPAKSLNKYYLGHAGPSDSMTNKRTWRLAKSRALFPPAKQKESASDSA